VTEFILTAKSSKVCAKYVEFWSCRLVS